MRARRRQRTWRAAPPRSPPPPFPCSGRGQGPRRPWPSARPRPGTSVGRCAWAEGPAPGAAAASDRVVAGGSAGGGTNRGPDRSQRMARFLRFLAWTAGTLVVLATVAIGVVYFYVTSNVFRRRIESQASALAGRKTTIADIPVDWGFTSHVHMSGVAFANAEWAKEPHMLKAEQVDFEIRLWPLLKGDLVLPSLVLRKPEIVIEKNDKDRLNWELGEAP